MNKKYKTKSRLKTPWDNLDTLSPIESFIKSNYQDDYHFRHRLESSTNTIEFLNQYYPSSCPYCSNNSFIKKGLYSNGIHRYKCRSCNKYFNILTNTIFMDHKISITEWIRYILNIISYGSISLTSKIQKIVLLHLNIGLKSYLLYLKIIKITLY